MADEAPIPTDQTADPNAPQFAPQAVYLKDVSFEAPAGPRVASNAANPTINLNLNTSVSDMGPSTSRRCSPRLRPAPSSNSRKRPRRR
jgi:preprotein translocase subunit SecB